MSYYCSRQDIEDGLPTNWQGVLSTAQLDECREHGTNVCDSALPEYWPMPDVTATPSTPRLVREAARLYGLSRAYSLLGGVNNDGDNDTPAARVAEADAILAPIAKGERIIPRVTVVDENISLGSLTLYPNEHVLAASPKTVIIPSVRMTGLVYGVHFDVLWRPEVRSYMLRAFDVTAVAALDKVSYEFSYLRKEEIADAGPDRIRLIRA